MQTAEQKILTIKEKAEQLQKGDLNMTVSRLVLILNCLNYYSRPYANSTMTYWTLCSHRQTRRINSSSSRLIDNVLKQLIISNLRRDFKSTRLQFKTNKPRRQVLHSAVEKLTIAHFAPALATRKSRLKATLALFNSSTPIIMQLVRLMQMASYSSMEQKRRV